MQYLNKKNLILILGLSFSIFLSACGEERNHKPLPKIEVYKKSAIDTNAEYLYVPSTDEVSRTTSQGRPFWQGDHRIIKFKFEKNHLVAYAQEKDDRFDDNTTNSKPVFRIPIRHVDYREAEDPFGEGTNIEEENDYLTWQDRKYFEPSPEEFEFSDVNLLPSEYGKIFGYECSTETGQAELEFKVDDVGMDILIKRDYRTNYFCSKSVTDLFDLAWSEITHYSIVKMDKLVHEDYKVINYDREWERTYGYFETLDQKIDNANNTTQDGEIYYLNRWNPKRKEVVYNLDPRFEKPGNQSIKAATIEGFKRLNHALDQAGVNFDLKLQEGPKDMRPGDLRYNSIVLVEDPLAVGLLGYGPTVANPRTGEIVQAKTVMYPGVMKQYIRLAYDELLRKEAQKAKQMKQEDLLSRNNDLVQEIRSFGQLSSQIRSGNDWKPHQGALAHLATNESSSEESVNAPEEEQTETNTNAIRHLSTVNLPGSGDLLPPNPIANTAILKKDFLDHGDKLLFDHSKFSLRTAFQGFKDQNLESEFNIDPLQVMEFFSRYNMMPARLKSFVDITDGALRDQVVQLGQRQDWDDLDAKTRSQIVDLILPYVWIPTLIHEVGHNLGLRHNFAGSEDEAHFYTQQELENLGVEAEYSSPYASMMEYTKSEITSLRVPGKYDIAALRYGYNQQVPLKDGSLADVKDKLPADMPIEVFEYCSDEGVSLNPNCNRFDEGVGYEAIARNIIDSYKERYELRNFRRGRSNFSLMDEIYYASRINSQFRSLRLMLERFSDILVDFDLDLATVESIDWLKDMNEGAKLSADFFMEVLAEPDLSCVIMQNGQFSQIIRYSEIKSLTGSINAKDCFDIEGLNGGFEIAGQFGRQFESEKYRDNPNIYLDQIDVRGVWIDKLLALKYLVARNLNSYSFDEKTLSYLDHPEISSKVNDFVKNLLLGDVISHNTVTFSDGSQIQDFEYGHSFSNDYSIKKPLTPYVNRYLGIKYDKIDFAEATSSLIQNQIYKGETSLTNEDFKESLRVYDYIPEDGRAPGDFQVYHLGPQNYVVSQDNELGVHILSRLNKIDLYERFTRKELIQIFEVISQGQDLPADASQDQIDVANAGVNSLLLYLRDELPRKDYYYRVLSNLAY